MIMLVKPHISIPHFKDPSAYSLGISTALNSIDQKRNVLDIQPGLHTIVSVTPQSIATSEGFDDLDTFKRKCKLPHETYGLKLVQNYTRTSCEHECAFMKAVTTCECMPWYYRNYSTSIPICEMFGGHCFNKIMSTRKFYKECSKDCLEDCNGMQLSWEQRFQPINIEKICVRGGVLHKYLLQSAKQHFSQDHYNRLTSGNKEQFIYLDKMMRSVSMSDHYVTLCKQFVEKHIAIISVEAPVDVITLTLRDLSVTWMDKIGILGGTLGLFTGVSMISILDVIKFIRKMIGGSEKENDDDLCEEGTSLTVTSDFF